jgi:hypothetical protein
MGVHVLLVDIEDDSQVLKRLGDSCGTEGMKPCSRFKLDSCMFSHTVLGSSVKASSLVISHIFERNHPQPGAGVLLKR